MLTVEQDPNAPSSHCGLENSTEIQPRARRVQKCAANHQRTGNWSKQKTPGGDQVKREKNRLAAAKCRDRKRQSARLLHEKNHAVTMANKLMKEEIQTLRNQLSHLRMLALKHSMCEFSCDCDAIRKYNANRALLAALGARDLGGWEKFSLLPSPVSNDER